MKTGPRKLSFGASKHHQRMEKPRARVLIAVAALCSAALAVVLAAWLRANMY